MEIQFYKSILAIFMIGILAVGCQTGTKKTSENNVQFDSIVVEKKHHLLDNPSNPNCNLQIAFTFPSKYADSEVLQKIQEQFVFSYFGETYEGMTPEEAVATYTEDYLNMYKELEPEFKTEQKRASEQSIGAWFSYFEMSSNNVSYNQNDLISYTVNFENYTGGAHGAHSYNNHVLNLKTGTPLTEEDIFIENYQDILAKMLVEQIAKQNNVSDPKELENIGYFSVDEIFPNNNFRVDEKGITYTFNEYEIAAYVVGAVNVLLPYNEIQHLLKKESPLSCLVD